MTVYSQDFDDETPGNPPAGWTRLAGPTGWNAVVGVPPMGANTPPNALYFPNSATTSYNAYYGRLNAVANSERYNAYIRVDPFYSSGRLGMTTGLSNSSSLTGHLTRVYVDYAGGTPTLKAYSNSSLVVLAYPLSGWHKISVKHYPAENAYEVYLDDVLLTPTKLAYYAGHTGSPQAILLYFYTANYAQSFYIDSISVTSEAVLKSGIHDCTVQDARMVV
jgi:hypothetical protein